MAANRQTAVQSARAMLEQGAALRGHTGLEIRLVLANRESRPVEEGNDLVENTDIAGHFKVMEDRVRQPQKIIGDTGPNAPSGRWMPPMLDIALNELPCGSPQQLRTRDVSFRHRERHYVLELITKAIRTAGLIKRRSRPDATRQRLIEQPAVEQNVHRPIRCGHQNRTKNDIPLLRYRPQCPIEVSPPVARNQNPLLFRGRRLTEEKDNLSTAARTQLNRGLQGSARIEAGADLPGESVPSFERCRMVEGAVATKKLRPITRPRGLAPAEVGKGHASTELSVPGIARENRSRFGIDLRDYEGRGGAPRNAEHPFELRRHRETSGPAGGTLDSEPGNLDWVIEWHEL